MIFATLKIISCLCPACTDNKALSDFFGFYFKNFFLHQLCLIRTLRVGPFPESPQPSNPEQLVKDDISPVCAGHIDIESQGLILTETKNQLFEHFFSYKPMNVCWTKISK